MTNKVKQYREKLGISQEQLAKDSGLSRTLISGIETGSVTNVTTDTITKICKALKESPAKIFCL